MKDLTPISADEPIRAYIVEAPCPEGKDYVPFFPKFEDAEWLPFTYGLCLHYLDTPHYAEFVGFMDKIVNKEPGYKAVIYVAILFYGDKYAAQSAGYHTYSPK